MKFLFLLFFIFLLHCDQTPISSGAKADELKLLFYRFTLKHFINRHVVLNSKLLFQDHASLAYILGGNRLSDKTRITVLLLFVMMLFYFALNTVISNRVFEREKSIFLRTNLVNSFKKDRPLTVRQFEVTGVNRYNPFITFSTPLILTMFLMTFSLGGCIGLSKHSSQTPWGALGIAINNDTPTIGLGGADTGSSTGTGSGTSTGTGTGTGSGGSTNTGTGTGGSTVSSGQTGFGTPGQGGGSTGSGSNGAGTPVAGMIFFHNDQIGSTKLMTNAAGEMVTGSNGAANIVYNPYGDIDVDHSHGPDILRNKFTGQQLDNESGLYYYNARYYGRRRWVCDQANGRKALGRFITADSVMDTGGANGMNRYMYTNGNPVLRNDPSGHDAPKWMENMNKDIKQAMVESVVQQAGAPLTLAYMMKTSRDRSHYEGKAGRALENPGAWFDRQVVNPIQHMNTTELVIGTVIFVAAVITTIAVSIFTAGLGLPWAVGFFAGIATGVAVSISGQVAGRALNGYAESNLSRAKWNSDKADRGQAIGGSAAGLGSTVGGLLYSMSQEFGINLKAALGNPVKFGAVGDMYYEYFSSEVWGAALGYKTGPDISESIKTFSDKPDRTDQPGSIYNQRAIYYFGLYGFDYMAIANDVFSQYVSNKVCKSFQDSGCPY